MVGSGDARGREPLPTPNHIYTHMPSTSQYISSRAVTLTGAIEFRILRTNPSENIEATRTPTGAQTIWSLALASTVSPTSFLVQAAVRPKLIGTNPYEPFTDIFSPAQSSTAKQDFAYNNSHARSFLAQDPIRTKRYPDILAWKRTATRPSADAMNSHDTPRTCTSQS